MDAHALHHLSFALVIGMLNPTKMAAPMIEFHGGVCVIPGQPTRWEGNRVIDYPVTNIDKRFKMCLLGHALSDHPLIQLTVDHRVSHIPQTSFQPTQKYQPPDTMAIIDTWKEMLETAWNDQRWNFHGTIKNQAHCNQCTLEQSYDVHRTEFCTSSCQCTS